jgi:pyruvate/2-oxoglutarate/acetoin dehydrogenase E1 component
VYPIGFNDERVGKLLIILLIDAPAGATLIAAGLLLSAIRDPNPVVFFEAKMMYRTAVEEVGGTG